MRKLKKPRRLRRYKRKYLDLKRRYAEEDVAQRALDNDVNVIEDDSREVFEPDAHCCSEHDDGNGYCTFCGAVIPGTFAYAEVYGADVPEVPRYHWSDY